MHDPVFGLIEAHRKADRDHEAALDEEERLERIGDHAAADLAGEASCHAAFMAFDVLLAAAATTLPGIVAKLAYLQDIAHRDEWMLTDRPDAAILLLEGFAVSVANVGAIMTDWTLEELAKLQATRLRRTRLSQASNAPPATTETRIALVAFELGLSESKLEPFYFVNRKGAKKRHFDTKAFAKKYGIDIRWIWDGELCSHPRGLERKQTRKKGGRLYAQPQDQGGDAA